ncbi:MAG TPA: DUF1559 domain-containing protein [Pirellulales bacterium]|nr:DUF1559 domain-containing protein [Pirellulales bacterium]
MLGFGALVKPDVPAAAMGAWAAYGFWKWLREPAWPLASLAGTALGLAELTKFTLLVFFLIWPAAWLAKRLWVFAVRASTRRSDALRKTSYIPVAQVDRTPHAGHASNGHHLGVLRELAQLASIVVLALTVVNAGYAFSGSFQPLGEYRFQSRALSGQQAGDPSTAGNRFATSWLRRVLVPLPRDFVQGVDRQRTDFEQGERSYLCGRWQPRGWWYYHLFGLMIKSPLGTLALVGLTLCLTFARLVRRVPETCGVGDELFLLAPAVAILALVSSQTGFSNHVRYTIPALPYLFIWCGKCVSDVPAAGAATLAHRALWLRIGCWGCIAASAVGSLLVYPHSISYFNLLAGGPKNDHLYLLESNIACGQDLIYLKNGSTPTSKRGRWASRRSVGSTPNLRPSSTRCRPSARRAPASLVRNKSLLTRHRYFLAQCPVHLRRKYPHPNNLRNMAAAIANHESAHGRLPSNGWGFQWFGDPDRGTGINQSGGWIYNVLPYLERRDLAVVVASQPDPAKRQLAAKANQVVVGLFYCPTRRGAALYPFDTSWPPRNALMVAETSKTDYAINAGDVFIPAGGPVDYQQAASPTYVWTDFSKATGVSYFRSMVTLAHIRDGTSQTYLIGEKNLSTAGMDPGDDQSLLVGYDLDNSRWTLPGKGPLRNGSTPAPRSFGSMHPGVCQFIMCDGSAHEISFSIDPTVHRRLGNRMDGQPIDDAAW